MKPTLMTHLLGATVRGIRTDLSPHGTTPAKPRGTPDSVRELADRIDRLQLVCTALWALLEEKTGLKAEDLAAKVNELDLADGKLDGKISRDIQSCEKCGRALSPRHQKCLYCGSAKLHKNPFDAAS